MNILETIKNLLNPTEKVPYTCSDGFVVQHQADLQYQLLIDKALEQSEDNWYTFDNKISAIYKELSVEHQFSLSKALLERAAFKNERPDHSFHLEKAASWIFRNNAAKLTQKGVQSFLKHLRTLRKQIGTFAFEEELVEAVFYQLKYKELHTDLKIEFQHWLDYLNSLERNYVDRASILLSKLLNQYDPRVPFSKAIQMDYMQTESMKKRLWLEYPLTDKDPFKEQQLLVDKFMKEATAIGGSYNIELKKSETFNLMKTKPIEEQKDFVMAAMLRAIWGNCMGVHNWPMYQCINAFLRRKLPFVEAEMVLLLHALKEEKISSGHLSWGLFFKNVQNHVKKEGVSDKLFETLQELMKSIKNPYSDKGFDKFLARVREVMALRLEDSVFIESFFLDEEDTFGLTVNEEISNLSIEERILWYKILVHASKASAGKPSKKFLKDGGVLLDTIEQEAFKTQLRLWLTRLIDLPISSKSQWYSYFLKPNNVSLVKGLLWLMSLDLEKADYPVLEKLLIRCFKKLPGVGPTCGAVGNAIIYAVANQNSLEGVSFLNRVRPKIRQRNTKKLMDKYILQIAETLQISVEDLADLSVPNFGLKKGEKFIEFSDYKAHLFLTSDGKSKLTWLKPDGKTQKSIPAFVKKDFVDELKVLKEDVKMIPKIISAQKNRLDRSYIHNRSFNWEHFQTYYIQHGLMNWLSRNLIWVFEDGEEQANAIFYNNQWQIADGTVINWMSAETQVRLWHPLDSETKEVLAWRDFLQQNEIKQAFKQAFREVYILTAAELNTRSYSNRMAAHIIKQHQFNALANLRDWKYSLLGAYDDGRDGEVASIHLPAYNLTAEYWVNEVNADDAWNETGIWLYVATDQVRFSQGTNVLNLIDVPKIPFSEIMRDVDLFVGVASVGNDPQWQDNGGLPQFRDYWESYSFGDLSEIAKMRKGILEKLLPRLKISKIARIEGKFLIVEGKIRTYKIHIGSTNILMEPNDQYLCIVPDRSTKSPTSNLFIPFEGDKGLSVVLSKAFLLAEDDKITDTTITRQLQ